MAENNIKQKGRKKYKNKMAENNIKKKWQNTIKTKRPKTM